MEIQTLEPIDVLCLTLQGGMENMPATWADLEGRLPTLRGRKFYGAFLYATQVYRVCVMLDPSDPPDGYGLERWTIPGGHYARRKLVDWQDNPDMIPQVFGEMAEQVRPDGTRPSLEFYRSHDELILFLPVTE